MGDALSPSYDTRRPPSRGESSVPLVAKQMHYVHDVGTLHRRSRSMHFSELHKKFGSTTRGLAVAEDEEYSDNLPAHHDRILGELSTQLVEHTAAAGPPSRSTLYRGDNDYSTNSDSTEISAQRGAPKVSPIKVDGAPKFSTDQPEERVAPSRADRVDVGNYIGPEARSAFFDLCAETQRERLLRAPDRSGAIFEYPEAAYNAPEGVTANMSPRQAFVNVLSESVFDGVMDDVRVCGLTPSPLIMRSGRAKERTT
jgi:hypothetical protein